MDVGGYLPLCRAIEQNDWKAVEDFIIEDPHSLTATITKDLETIFHKIVHSDKLVGLVKKLALQISPKFLEQGDSNEDTALSNAAIAGNTEAAAVFVNRNENLPNIMNSEGLLPIHQAALFGHKETVGYLLSVTGVDKSDEDESPFSGNSGFLLLLCMIKSNLYGMAFDLLKRHPMLARDEIQYRVSILEMLARKPQAFASGSRHGYWQRLIYHRIPLKEDHIPSSQTKKNDFPLVASVDGDTENPDARSNNWSRKSTTSGLLRQIAPEFGALQHKLHIMFWDALIRVAPSIKSIYNTKLEHMQVLEIVRMMCAGVFWSLDEASKSLGKPILAAARLGIYEFVDEIMNAYFHSYGLADQGGNNIFMLSVLHRREKVFSLITRVGRLKELATSFQDNSNNNILHLAGRLGPSSHVPGAALQMQRELQWFKALENFVHPSLLEAENSSEKTPREVFTEEHKDLVKEGEKWMKDTASSCTVVAALIITVVFTAAFTVPGGNDSRGIPNFLHESSFVVFAISDAFALFFSTTSVMMFLGILTSRYSEEDFMESLPKKLIFGLITLFCSIASMMIAFGATIYIVLSDLWSPVFLPIALLGALTVILFARLQVPLLIEMLLSTYRPIRF